MQNWRKDFETIRMSPMICYGKPSVSYPIFIMLNFQHDDASLLKAKPVLQIFSVYPSGVPCGTSLFRYGFKPE